MQTNFVSHSSNFKLSTPDIIQYAGSIFGIAPAAQTSSCPELSRGLINPKFAGVILGLECWFSQQENSTKSTIILNGPVILKGSVSTDKKAHQTRRGREGTTLRPIHEFFRIFRTFRGYHMREWSGYLYLFAPSRSVQMEPGFSTYRVCLRWRGKIVRHKK